MHLGIKQGQQDLDYGKYQYNTLVALFGYGDKNMIFHNKNRALAAIDCLQEILNDTKEFIEELSNNYCEYIDEHECDKRNCDNCPIFLLKQRSNK